MKQAKKFELRKPTRQVVVFADWLSELTLPLLKIMAKERGIAIEYLAGPTHQFEGMDGIYYPRPFETRVTVEVPPQQQELGEMQRAGINDVVNQILSCVSSRCVVYSAAGIPLYSRH